VVTGLDELLDSCTPEVRAVFMALRDLVRDVMLDAGEQLDIPDRLLGIRPVTGPVIGYVGRCGRNSRLAQAGLA
jgi:hypothetical protein